MSNMFGAWKIVVIAAALGCALNTGSAALAQSYPTRPIKLIVPFPPGGPNEFVIRILADRLSSKFGQAVIVENRPGGAGGTVGAAAVAAAEPDGYTLLASPPGPLVTATAVYKSLGYDPNSSFAPIALLFSSPQVLVVNPAVPAKSVQELIDYAKRHPGQLSFASPGYGTQPHLLGEMFKAAAGIDIVHVPYKGPPPAITDLLADRVQMYFETTAIILPHVQAGKLRALAVAGDGRIAQLQAPTMAECGFPQIVGAYWAGILAPSGTPPTVVNKLNAAINEIMQSDAVKLGLAKVSGTIKTGSPQDFAAFIAAEKRKWSAAARAAGASVN